VEVRVLSGALGEPRKAGLLIGRGLRISDALCLRIGDLERDGTGGTIVVYRST
jgi:hypothetical protein